MRAYLLLLTASVLLFLGSACTAPKAAAPQPDFRPTATIREVMESTIEPNADAVWNSVAIVSTAEFSGEQAPHTDEEWEEVRNHALTLVEATNLILVPGRRVAKPGEQADDPKVELSPEQIETLINQDREAWTKLVHGLHDAAMVALKAVDAKDTQAMFDAGDGIDKACENCHTKYWYPNQPKVQ